MPWLAMSAFLGVNGLGWLLVVNRMSGTERAVKAVLQYVVAHHAGEPLPPHVAALVPTIKDGARRA